MPWLILRWVIYYDYNFLIKYGELGSLGYFVDDKHFGVALHKSSMAKDYLSLNFEWGICIIYLSYELDYLEILS